ncbi:hypothetical protein CPT06_14435 [Bacillus vallismortis]|nr:hypothetical protein CPT06_14435 [Bacillus vallismortis]
MKKFFVEVLPHSTIIIFIRLAQETFRKRSIYLVIIVSACGNFFKDGCAYHTLAIFSADSSISTAIWYN